jgi:hypothetical protein
MLQLDAIGGKVPVDIVDMLVHSGAAPRLQATLQGKVYSVHQGAS